MPANGAVAVGVRGGGIAYGAACNVIIAKKSPKQFVICDNDLSGFGGLYKGEFVDDAEWMAQFIKKNCF